MNHVMMHDSDRPATPGLSWDFSLAEILASLSHQDRPWMMEWQYFLNEPASQPPGPLSYEFNKSLQLLVGFYSNLDPKLRGLK